MTITNEEREALRHCESFEFDTWHDAVVFSDGATAMLNIIDDVETEITGPILSKATSKWVVTIKRFYDDEN